VFEYGAEVIQTADSPFGRIAVAVCKDMSFPPYARQAGRAGADILLTGSHEFPRGMRLDDAYRSVESGVTHVRTTYNGISYAMDPYGHVLARMQGVEKRGGLRFADVPTRGAWTLYSRVGDWIGWLSIAALLGFAALAILAGRPWSPLTRPAGGEHRATHASGQRSRGASRTVRPALSPPRRARAGAPGARPRRRSGTPSRHPWRSPSTCSGGR